MANQIKNKIEGKVQKNGRTKFKIKKDRDTEVDVDIEIVDIPGDTSECTVEKLRVDDLPATVSNGDGTSTTVRWFNNFAIKKGEDYINRKYKVTIQGIKSLLGKSKLVIFDGNGEPYYYTGAISDDTFELTDGDPGIGGAP
jgi:hypothetical protein